MTKIYIIAVFFDGLQESISKKMTDIGFSLSIGADGTIYSRKRIFQGDEFNSKIFHDELLKFQNEDLVCLSSDINVNLDVDVIIESQMIVHLNEKSIFLMSEMKMGIGIRCSETS